MHGKAGRRGTVSDWMEMEKARGISITSAALQFAYGDHVVNLLDTPGHADFSEDTYRVLAAVDCAVMLIDAAKGLEPQTMKLVEVCRLPRHPGDHRDQQVGPAGPRAAGADGRDPRAAGLEPTPLNWPVGIAGDFRGVLDRPTGDFSASPAPPAARRIAPEEHLVPRRGARRATGDAWTTAVEESTSCSRPTAAGPRPEALPGRQDDAGAVRRGGAELRCPPAAGHPGRPAPPPRPRAPTRTAARGPVDAPFSAFVFKIQAGMDTAHRDRLAFVRVVLRACSSAAWWSPTPATGKPFATKYAQQVFGRDRDDRRHRLPGRRRRLVNASALRVGDSLYVEEPVDLPADPAASRPSTSPSPARATPAATSSSAAASSSSSRRASCRCCARTCAATRRRCSPPSGRCSSRSPSTGWAASSRAGARWTGWRTAGPAHRRPSRPASSAAVRGVEVLERADGALLALFADRWRAVASGAEHPDAVLETLVAGAASRARPRLAPMSTTSEPVPFEVYEPGIHLHGTKAHLVAGDLLVPGRESNFEAGRVMNHIYFTATLDAAVWGAELAPGEGRGRIYVVEPVGDVRGRPQRHRQEAPGQPHAVLPQPRTAARRARAHRLGRPLPRASSRACATDSARMQREGTAVIHD